MTAERDDARVIEAVESVCPEFTPALRQRVLSAIAVPARVPARPRRRLIAVAVGAAALLAGLGFVPLPLGRTHGVLTRAVAAMNIGLRSGAPRMEACAMRNGRTASCPS